MNEFSIKFEGQKGQRGTGKCSWYGDEAAGAYTSCGNIFNPNEMTGAQLGGVNPKLPCGTKIRVTNTKNKKSVDITITDKGSHASRLIDLSKGSFAKIEDTSKGIMECSYVVL